MGIIVILIAISLSIALIFLLLFYWSIKNGQYDDTYTHSVRMLFDYRSGKGSGKKVDNDQGPEKENLEGKDKAGSAEKIV